MKTPRKLLDADFVEGRVLPNVCAFGLGVVIALHAADAEVTAAHAAVRAMAVQVEQVRIACGAQPDPAAIAAAFVTHPHHEARK